MEVWRLCRARHEATAFSGIGAEKAGGRWNLKGHAMVYTSEHLSLAALELLVHVAAENVPDDLISIKGTLPADVSVRELREADLPAHWRTYPAPAELPAIGTAWLSEQRTAVLIVPSAINPLERNLLLNPRHADMKRLLVERGKPFQFDPRLFGKKKER